MARDRTQDLAASADLLQAELPDRRFVDEQYLRWLYDENPNGPTYEASIDDELASRRDGHYALISQRYRNEHGTARFVFSLNAVTRSGGQRRGTFQQLGAQVYAEAAADGVECVIGVSNANSTPPVVRRMGWRLLGPLPVRVAPARRSAEHWRSAWASDIVGTDEFDSVATTLDQQPARCWTNRWSAESLRWRLRAPNSSRYAVHLGDDAVAVTTLDHAGPVPVAVILKVLPRRRPGVAAIDGRGVVAAACRFHRSPMALHAGWNRWVAMPGIQVPIRARPVPLNLIVRSLVDRIDQDQFALDTFEFLDMDAY